MWKIIILFLLIPVLIFFLGFFQDTKLHVEGNHFTENGKKVILRGASRWSLEFSCGDGHFAPSDFKAMKSWGMNIVRIPFNENYFLNPNLCPTNYQETLFNAVEAAKKEGLYVLLDLHWIHPKEVENIDERGGQFSMPDMQTLEVWKVLAEKYKNDPQVLFDFMNEPHDIPCSVWRDGGIVVSQGGTGWINQVSGKYETPGFQKLINLVRDIGANNLIIQGVGGEASLMCALETPLSDPKNNTAYQAHFYTTNPNETWKTQYKNVTDNFPVIAGEFDGRQALNVLPFFENDLQTGYMFWAWTPDTPSDETWEKVRDFMIKASSSL